MVTAISIAARTAAAGDRTAADLCSLLLSRAVIRAPRWRAYASIQLVPALVRFKLPLASLRADIRRDVTGAPCPAPLRPVLDELLAIELDRPSPRLHVLERLFDALYRADWAGTALAAAAAAMLAGDAARFAAISAVCGDRPAARRLRELHLRGLFGRHGEHGSWGDFVGNVTQRGSESAFAPSVPLVIATVDAMVGARAFDRLPDLERVVAKLSPRERPIGHAHVARALLALHGERAATIRLHGIRERSIRAGATLLLVRAALAGHVAPLDRDDPEGTVATATRFAAAIEPSLDRQRADLAIARHLFEIGQPVRARRLLARVTHPSLKLAHGRLRTTIALQFRRIAPMDWSYADVERERSPEPWLGEPFVDPETRVRTLRGVQLLRVAGNETDHEVAARELRGAASTKQGRRELLELLAAAGLDPFAAIVALRGFASGASRSTSNHLTDPLFAEAIGVRAAALARSDGELPEVFRDGLDGRAPDAEVDARSAKGPARRLVADNVDARLVAELLGARPSVPDPYEIAGDTRGGAEGRGFTPAGKGSRARARVVADRASLERAMYDEGVAISATAERKRRAIIAAARACLRGAIERPDEWPREVVAARARTLAHFGGTLAKEALESALAIRPGSDVYVPQIIETLCQIEPAAAARIAIERATRVRRDPKPARATDAREIDLRAVDARVQAASSSSNAVVDAIALLRTVTLYGGLPIGFASAWEKAMDALRVALARGVLDEPTATSQIVDQRARAWLAELCAMQGVPSIETLRWIAGRAELRESPRALFEQAAVEVSESLDAWPIDAARRVAEDGAVLDTMLLLGRPQVETRAARWGHGEWTMMLRRAGSVETGVVEPAMVVRCARLLNKTSQLRWLLAGDLVSLGVEKSRDVQLGGLPLRVRLLEKRGDLLAYLRFADVPVPNCYRTDSSYYRSSRDDTIAVWKDPLSYCFRIERVDGRPWGFVFGGFAEVDGDIAAVLNGLYLRRQELEPRTAVLAAIEEMLCRPLGIRRIGVARSYGGVGAMPAKYRSSSVSGTRMRALAVGGARVTRTYDDISRRVNEPVGLDLWWRCLD